MAQVKGLDRLLRQLEGLVPAAEAEMQRVLEEQARQLAEAIQARAPHRTGRLAASIGSVKGPPPAGSGMVVGRNTGAEASAALAEHGLLYSVYAGSDEAYWAKFVEFGTRAGREGDTVSDASHRTRKVKRTHPGTQAQPFFFPTVRARAPLIKRRVWAAATRAVKKAASTP